MFYPEKIQNILGADRVLEIGPGNTPFHRSDVLLELSYDSDEDRIRQFGHSETLHTDKQVVFYDGKRFPFEDKSFDYIICSHVLEHIDDVDYFLSEIFRVGKKGYFEYPLVTYDYLYNFDVHLNFLKFDGTRMLLMKKDSTTLRAFRPLQEFFLKTLEMGYGDFITHLPQCFFEGFEWKTPFEVHYSQQLGDFMEKNTLPVRHTPQQEHSIKSAAKLLSKAIRNRLTRK